jgi:predicted ATP-dependent serine protease
MQQGMMHGRSILLCLLTGVRSGTGIIDDLLLQRVHQLVQELHMLCITSEEAADAISKMSRKLPLQDFQQLQVSFPSTHAKGQSNPQGHPMDVGLALSDQLMLHT